MVNFKKTDEYKFSVKFLMNWHINESHNPPPPYYFVRDVPGTHYYRQY